MQRKKQKVPVRSTVAQISPAAEQSPAGQAPETRRKSQSAAIEEIYRAIPQGPRGLEGTRVLVFGASGKGKTFFTVRAVQALQDRRLCTTAVVLDLKDPEFAQYEGRMVSTIDEARAAFLDEAPPFLVCRTGVTAAEASTLVKEAAESGERVAFFGDEMTPLLKVNDETGEPMARVFSDPALVWLQLQARSLGASCFLLVNLPQIVPTSALDQASANVVFGVGGRSLDYLLDFRIIPRRAVDTVAHLDRGQCCLFFPDREWDGIVYGPE